MISLAQGEKWEKVEACLPAYLQFQPAWVFLLPETVNNMNFYQMPDIWIEGRHEKLNVMEIVELPALRDEWIAKNLLECDCILVQLPGQVSNFCQAEGRIKNLTGC